MPSVTISDGARVVVVEEVQERRPSPPMGMEAVPDVTGEVVIYEKVGRLREVPVSGRVKSQAEVAFLEVFLDEGLMLYLTDRDGTVTGGWRMKSDPLPVFRRKDGDSADYLCEFRLWRTP